MSARRQNYQDEALKVLEHARTKLPDDPKLLLDCGIQATEMGLLQEANESLQAARKLDAETIPTSSMRWPRLEMQEQHLQAAEADLRVYLTQHVPRMHRPILGSERFWK